MQFLARYRSGSVSSGSVNTVLVTLLTGIFPVYTPGGKSPLQGNIRYISLAVPLILEAAMVQIILFDSIIVAYHIHPRIALSIHRALPGTYWRVHSLNTGIGNV